MKRTPLKRRTPLKSTTAIRSKINREEQKAWAKHGRTKVCAVCGARGVHGHHIIDKQVLVQRARDLGRDDQSILCDFRNYLPLCPRHHEAHHTYASRLSLKFVVKQQPKVMSFARELDLVWWLERMYL